VAAPAAVKVAGWAEHTTLLELIAEMDKGVTETVI
jgi:hypothetical protein